MKLNYLKIKNFRGLTFEHSFENEQFVVLTGINGSGKSTIIEAIDLLLTRNASGIQKDFAEQVTAKKAIFEIETEVLDEEIDYLADRIKESQPNQVDKNRLINALKENIFVNNKFIRKIEIVRPELGWTYHDNIKETINGVLIDSRNGGLDKIIHPGAFNVFSNELVIKFNQLENLTLQFSNFGRRKFSVKEIFQPSETTNIRTDKTNVNLSPVLDSLLVVDVNKKNILELIEKYNFMLDPIWLEIEESNATTSLVLKRTKKGNAFSINTASSGQKKAIALITLSYLWERSAIKPIVLIDEPENSMHPGLTSKIFSQLNTLSNIKGDAIQPSFIIATHSPEVVAANPNSTFRIITVMGKSFLEKIKGLEARARILSDLGVHFHLDYVAQKIVFVESQSDAKKMADAEVYQRLIDPYKEKVLFVLAQGGFTKVKANTTFVNNLFDKLNVTSPELVFQLRDRDNHEYNSTIHTPFKEMEYVLTFNKDLLQEMTLAVLGKNETSKVDNFFCDINTLQLYESENYKQIWEKFTKILRIKSENQRKIQEKILDELRENNSRRDSKIDELMERYS